MLKLPIFWGWIFFEFFVLFQDMFKISSLLNRQLFCLVLLVGNVPMQAAGKFLIDTTDVCILSGSEAGFTASIQVARLGKKVILIEPTGHAGGMMVEGIVKDIRFGSSAVIGGIARELYENLEAHYSRVPNFNAIDWYCPYEPSVAEQKINSLLAAEKNITVIH